MSGLLDDRGAERGAYALSGGAVGGAGGVAGGEVAALAALDDLEGGAGFGGDGSGDGGGEAVALKESLSDGLQAPREDVNVRFVDSCMRFKGRILN